MANLQRHVETQTQTCNLDHQLGPIHLPPGANGYKEITKTVTRDTNGMLVTSREYHIEYLNPANPEQILVELTPTVDLLKTENVTGQQFKTHKAEVQDYKFGQKVTSGQNEPLSFEGTTAQIIENKSYHHNLAPQVQQNSQCWKRENIQNEPDIEKMLNDLKVLTNECNYIIRTDLKTLPSSNKINDDSEYVDMSGMSTKMTPILPPPTLSPPFEEFRPSSFRNYPISPKNLTPINTVTNKSNNYFSNNGMPPALTTFGKPPLCRSSSSVGLHQKPRPPSPKRNTLRRSDSARSVTFKLPPPMSNNFATLPYKYSKNLRELNQHAVGNFNDSEKDGAFARPFPTFESTSGGEKDPFKELAELMASSQDPKETEYHEKQYEQQETSMYKNHTYKNVPFPYKLYQQRLQKPNSFPTSVADSSSSQAVGSGTACKLVASPSVSHPPGLEILKKEIAIGVEQNSGKHKSNEESESNYEKSEKNEKENRKKECVPAIYYPPGVKTFVKKKEGTKIEEQQEEKEKPKGKSKSNCLKSGKNKKGGKKKAEDSLVYYPPGVKKYTKKKKGCDMPCSIM